MEGWQVNHKKVERLWGEEGLQLPHRHKKRRRLYHKASSVIRLRPTHLNHVWAADFVHDKLSNGRPYKMLTVLDEYTREALCVAVSSRCRSTRAALGKTATMSASMELSVEKCSTPNGSTA